MTERERFTSISWCHPLAFALGVAACGSVSNKQEDAGPEPSDACASCIDSSPDSRPIDARPPDAPPDAPDPYDFAIEFDGTMLPSSLGWTYASDCTIPFPSGATLTEGQSMSLNAGFLHADTTGPSSTFVDAYYSRDNIVDATRGWAIEARLRVTALEAAPPSTSQAFVMSIIVSGEFHTLQIGDNAVMTDDNTASAVTTNQFHVYRMRHSFQSSTYAVDVDGTQVLTTAPFQATVGVNKITFGDSTCQSRNGAVDVDYIRFTQP